MACHANYANFQGNYKEEGFNDLNNIYQLCWPNGEIFFKIEIFESQALLEKVYEAINHWNRVNFPHCVFKLASNQSYWVTFIQDKSGGCPKADIGCLHIQDQVISLPEFYPDGSEVLEECILHEMMHCAGFRHEHQRNDRDEHLKVVEEGFDYDVKKLKLIITIKP
ncbi:unnamed protein product [Blepharisma stoltei]|uniref:Peptidase metallopeptidase domain-containing protein n=1 Tax=Blepharisma stoltei TaxID=1481888 RepID=A0AAU9IDE6_9CILI|nr:unnamed protein product [Blepharisma stoltei]